MANVQVIQRHAHLAGPVRIETVNGREGPVSKATLTAISNTRRGSGENREEEVTGVFWTLWGRQAENAAEYLGKGSHVNIVGRLRNNNYQDADGKDVYGLAFIAEEIDYLDSRAESEARRVRGEGEGTPTGAGASGDNDPPKAASPSRKPRIDSRAKFHKRFACLPLAAHDRLMNTSSRDFVTVDMRGLKAALVARAKADRVSVSVLVRGAVERELGLAGVAEPRPTLAPIDGASNVVKLSIRMTRDEAERVAAGARGAGLSRGAYLAGLVADVPVLTQGASRVDHLASLVASCAELSTLSRNIHHLTSLLRQGDVRPAMVYREMLDTLAGDVRRHLKLAAGVLADLRPRGGGAGSSKLRND